MIEKFDRVLDRIHERFGLIAATITFAVLVLAFSMATIAVVFGVAILFTTLLPSWVWPSLVIGTAAVVLGLVVYFIAITWRD